MQVKTKLSNFKASIMDIFARFINVGCTAYFCVFVSCIPFVFSLTLSEHSLGVVLFQITSIPSHFVCQVLHFVF